MPISGIDQLPQELLIIPSYFLFHTAQSPRRYSRLRRSRLELIESDMCGRASRLLPILPAIRSIVPASFPAAERAGVGGDTSLVLYRRGAGLAILLSTGFGAA